MYTAFADFLSALLGVYTPPTVTVDGVTHVLSGMAGVDFPYVVRALVFIIFVWSMFRILGGLLCSRK